MLDSQHVGDFPKFLAFVDALLDDLVISGSEEHVAAGLRGLLTKGIGQVLAAPVIDPEDRDGSMLRAFRAVALASH